MKTPRSLMNALLGLCLFLAAVPAFARYTDCTAPLPMNVSTPNVGALSTLQPGQPIPGTRTAFSFVANCNYTFGASDHWYMQVNGAALNTTSYPNVYTYGSLASSGIGIRVLDDTGTPMTYESAVPGFKLQSATTSSTLSATFELVKIGNTLSSAQQTTQWAFHVPNQQWVNQVASTSVLNYSYNISRPSIPTCSADVATLNVTLPDIGRQAFKSIGSTAGATAFGLGLRCEANVLAQLSFSDVTSPSNSGSSLALAAGSTANGLGVQLLSQGQVVVLSPAGGSAGSLVGVKGASSAQVITIPLVAQYVQTDSAVSPGTVLATAAYTLTYQ